MKTSGIYKLFPVGIKPSVQRGFWTVADQSVVSAGTFIVHVLLARHLPSVDYGVFSLLYGGLITLQLFNANLIIYPLSVRLVTATDEEHAHLLVTAGVLIGSLTVVLSVVLVIALLVSGQWHLIGPALCCFVLWQVQEAMRRALFTRFRHRTAMLGDAASYLGQSFVIIVLLSNQKLTIAGALYAMGMTSAIAAVLQFLQLDLKICRRFNLRQAASDCWFGGGVQALAAGLLSQARFMVFPWTLAIASGPAAAGAFQAAANINNLSNPIMNGLGNIVPQAAAEAVARGKNHAWLVVRSYLHSAMPIIISYSLVIAVYPAWALGLLYGTHSEYLKLTTPVRLLIIGNIFSYICEFIVWLFYGISLARLVLSINVVGFLASLLLLLMLTGSLGLIGGCLALFVANVIRLAFAVWVLFNLLRG